MPTNVRSKAIITTGFPQVDNLLATLEPKLQKKAIRKGTRGGAKAVLAKAKIGVPMDDLVLRDTLVVRTARVGPFDKKLKRHQIGHTVWHVQRGGETGDEDDPFYSVFAEYGTVKWVGDEYIRPALFESKNTILSAVRQEMVRGVNEIAAKSKAKAR